MDIVISLGSHGLKGFAVQTTHEIVLDAIELAKSTYTRQECEQLRNILVRELRNGSGAIMSGKTFVDSYGELYDKQKFNDDLVWVAIYDHVANNKPIGLMMEATV